MLKTGRVKTLFLQHSFKSKTETFEKHGVGSSCLDRSNHANNKKSTSTTSGVGKSDKLHALLALLSLLAANFRILSWNWMTICSFLGINVDVGVAVIHILMNCNDHIYHHHNWLEKAHHQCILTQNHNCSIRNEYFFPPNLSKWMYFA